ncbi:MAG: 50S ribosomal protein L35 [Planctomycetota bacterium]
MPKQKTHKGLAKRVRVTRRGKVMRGKAGRRHLLSGKSGKRKRQLRQKAKVAPTEKKRIKRALG